MENLEEQLSEIEVQNMNSYQLTKLITKYTEITELTAPMLKELIGKI